MHQADARNAQVERIAGARPAAENVWLWSRLALVLALAICLLAGFITTQRLARSDPPAAVQVLAPDVEVHLGDQDFLAAPWKRLYHYQPLSTFWQGDFYLTSPGNDDWSLAVDVLQPNDRANILRINNQSLTPPVLAGRDADWSGNWTRFILRVPNHVLQAGHNTITFEVGQWMPSLQGHDTFWEDLQIRNIRLYRD